MKPIRTAEILCVGTELLLGDIINTDAAYLARRLSELGICVYHQTVVGDHPGRLGEALDLALSRADLVITSGGLGPTYDDLTKETVAARLGRPLATDPAVLDDVKAYFARVHRVMTPNNEKQALVPEDAVVFRNDWGTAPGLAVTDRSGEHTVILLPGPPIELEPMFDKYAMPYLKERTDHILVSYNLHILGMSESAVENALRDLMVEGQNPTVAPYCKAGEVRLRVTAMAESDAAAVRLCEEMTARICSSPVGSYIYAIADSREGEYTIERVAIEKLLAAGKTVAVAESCTGGLIAKRLTDVPGSSGAVLGGCVTYTNEMKQLLLGVNAGTLAEYTAVSEPVAREMAEGIRARTGADIGVATTGLAGPGGGSEDCPVGTVYVAVSSDAGTSVRRLSLSPTRTREYIRTVAATHAISMVIGEI